MQKLVSDGDVVEMEDTLVLETSAFAHESSNLSIPTSFQLERTANGEAIRPEPGGSREG